MSHSTNTLALLSNKHPALLAVSNLAAHKLRRTSLTDLHAGHRIAVDITFSKHATAMLADQNADVIVVSNLTAHKLRYITALLDLNI